MIVTHLPQSYPQLLSEVGSERTRSKVLKALAEKTLGDWSRVSDKALDAFADVVVGVYQGRVVSAFDVTSHERAADGKVRFTGSPSTDWEWLVGSEAPGGPWQRGESRPVRYLDSDAVRSEHANLARLAAGIADPQEKMWQVLEAHAAKASAVPAGAPNGSLSLLEQVQVALNPRGGVNVSVPAGTRVTVIPRG